MDKKQRLAWLLIIIMVFQTGSPAILQAGVGNHVKASDTVWDIIEDEDAGWWDEEEAYSGSTASPGSADKNYLVTSYATFSNAEVPFGTALHELQTKLPGAVNVFGRLASPSDSSVEMLGSYPVQWKAENYVEDTPSDYPFSGTVTLPDKVTAEADLASPSIIVTVKEQELFNATITLDWVPIAGHDVPTVERLKDSVLGWISGEDSLPDSWKENLEIFVAPRIDGKGWICTIKGIPAQYGSKALEYQIEPALKDFIFGSGGSKTISASAPALSFLCMPVLKPTLVIENSTYGTHLETISYMVSVDGHETEYKVRANVKFAPIQLPDGTEKVSVWLKADQSLYTWGDEHYDLTFSAEEPSQTVTFHHSAMIEPAIITLNWNDNHNASGKRPSGATFSLRLGAPAGCADALSDVNIEKNDSSYNTWKWTYSGLPRYDKMGVEIPYTLAAEEVVGYVRETLKGPALHEFEARYTIEREFEVKLEWLDNNDAYKTRPESFPENTFTLWKDGKSASLNDYKLEIEGMTLRVKGLPAFEADGIGILWSIKQNEILSIAMNTVSGKQTGEPVSYKPHYVNEGTLALVSDAVYHNGRIQNRLNDTFQFTGTKIWQDGNESDKRTRGSLILQRYLSGGSIQNATPISGNSTIDLKTKTDEASYGIAYEGLENLPRFDEKGHEYIYFVTERFVDTPGADSYEKIFKNTQAYQRQQGSNSYLFPGGSITNRRTGTIVSNVTVRWNTAAQQSVESFAYLEPQYRVKGTTTEDWMPMDTQTVGPFFAEQLSITKKFTWSKYDDIGRELEYRVIETAVQVGNSKVNVTDNAFTIGDYSYVVTVHPSGNDVTITHSLAGTHEVKITKVWKSTPSDTIKELGFDLYQNGNKYKVIKMEQNPGNAWSLVVVSDLPAYDNTGKLYSYDVREQVPSGYHASYSYGADTNHPHNTDVTVTNTPTSESTNYTLTLEKKWLDGGDTVYRQPVTVGVYRKEDDRRVSFAVLDKQNNWWKYVSVPAVYKDEEKKNKKSLEEAMTADYYVRESQVGADQVKYEGQAVSNDDFEGENQHYAVSCTPNEGYNVYTAANRRIGTLDIEVDTSWVDGNRKNEDRPKLQLTLLRNGSSTGKSVTLDGTQDDSGETGSWKTEIKDLPKYDNLGNLYDYTIGIDYVQGSIPDDIGDYSRSFSRVSYEVGEKHTGDKAVYHCSMKRQTIITNFMIHLIWMDNGFVDDSIRPNTYLTLYRKTSKDENKPETVTDAQRTWNTQMTDWHWTCGFDGLPKYNDEGYLYEYYVTSSLSTQGDYVTRYYEKAPEDNQFEIKEEGIDVGIQNGTVVHRRERERIINGTKTWQNVPGSMEADDYPQAEFRLHYYHYTKDELSTDGMKVSGLNEAVTRPEEPTKPLIYTIEKGGNSFDFGKLPRYDSLGRNIQYFVKETPIAGYVELTGAVGQFVLSNAYSEDAKNSRTITVRKLFFGFSSTLEQAHYPVITMELWRQMQRKDGALIGTPQKVADQSIVVTETGEGTCSFTMPAYAPNSNEWYYTIKEKAMDGYEIQGSPGDGYLISETVPSVSIGSPSNIVSIENTYTGGERRKISVEKTWNDQDNRYKTRPAAITVNLYRHDSVGENQLCRTQQLTETDSWKYVFENLETYAPNGTKYKYFVQEEEVKGYQDGTNLKAVGDSQEETVAITNTLRTKDLNVAKQWRIKGEELKAGSASYGLLPADMKVELTLQVATDDAWHTVVRDDTEYKESIAIGGTEETPRFTYENQKYVYTFKDLPGYDGDGREYKYRVRETGLQSAEITGGPLYIEIEATTIGPYDITYEDNTNTITNEVREVNYLYLQTVWKDADNQDGLRPDALDFTIAAAVNGVDDKINKISVSKPKNTDGIADTDKKTHWPLHVLTLPAISLNSAPITYSGEQSDIKTGYEVTSARDTVPGDKTGDRHTFTFTHIPKTLALKVEKKWDYAGVVEDQEYKTLVDSMTIHARLQKVTDNVSENVEGQDIQPLQKDAWCASWHNLPAAQNTNYQDVASTGKSTMITYTVMETQADGAPLANGKLVCFLPPAYTTYIADKNTLTSPDPLSGGVTITNKLETITHKVNQRWEDSTNLYKTRPGTQTTMILQRRKGESGSFAPYSRGDISVIVVTTPGDKNQSGDGEWKALPRYASDGTEYRYRALETKMETHDIAQTDESGNTPTGKAYNYDVTYDFNDRAITVVTNKNIINEAAQKTFHVQKEWDDEKNNDNKRPSEVSIHLYRDGMLIQTVSLSAPGWEYTWDNLPKYKNGESTALSEYRVEEDQTKLPGGYSISTQSNAAYSASITNTYAPQRLTITASKSWANDDVYKDKTRPDEITIQLESKTDDVSSVWNINPGSQEKVIKKQPNGTWSTAVWDNLYRYSGGEKLQYRVQEKEVPKGYKTAPAEVTIVEESDGNPAVGTAGLVNTLETVDITIEKVWEDNADTAKVRPEHITVQLYRHTAESKEPVEVGDPTRITADRQWKHSFENQLKYVPETENPYIYSIRETHVGEQAVESVDAVGMMGGGYVVTEPPAQQAGADNKIGFTITNALPAVSHKVTQTWINDEGDKMVARPTSIVVELQHKDGEEWKTVQSKEIGKDASQPLEFLNLPKFDPNNKPYEYRVVETKIGDYPIKDGFACGYDAVWTTDNDAGTTAITNTLQTIKVEVEKSWEDANDVNKMRPEQVTIQLYREIPNGSAEVVAGTTDLLASAANWKTEYTEQLKYKPQTETEYAYSVRETMVGDYPVKTVGEKEMGGGYRIQYPEAKTSDARGVVTLPVTNILPLADHTITKEWADAEDSSQSRPDKIGITLQRKTGAEWSIVRKADILKPEWNITLSQIPQYTRENEIAQYRVTEDPVSGYHASEPVPVVAGTATLVNTLQTVSVTVNKTWEKDENHLSMRPDTITVQLWQQAGANGAVKAIGDSVELRSATDNTWKHTFTNLIRYVPGTDTQYIYSISEIKVGNQTVETIDGEKIGGGYRVTEPVGKTAEADETITLELVNSLILIDHEVKIIWENDKDNVFKTRPASITTVLQEWKDGRWSPVTEKEVLCVNGGEQYIFTGYPKYTADNQERRYRAVEAQVGSFPVEEGFAGGYFVSEKTTGRVTDITNRLDVVQLEGRIDWEDEDNRYRTRPEVNTLPLSITFAGDDMLLTPEWYGEWTYRYEALPRWYVDADGALKIRNYQIKETIPRGYLCDKPQVESNILPTGSKAILKPIQNRLSGVSIKGTKHWEDEDNRWGLRPTTGDDIKIRVEGDGAEITLGQEQVSWDGWNYTIKDLPRYNTNTGNPVVYSVTETPGAAYVLSKAEEGTTDKDGNYSGVDFTNRLKTGTLRIKKTVVGDKVPDGLSYSFTLTLQTAGTGTGAYNGTYTHISEGGDDLGKVVTSDGRILLKAGETAEITGIPDGVSYAVEEQKLPGFAITSTNATGIIASQKVLEVEFTNTVETDKLLGIENVTTTTGSPVAGGKVGVTTNAEGVLNPDKPNSDQTTAGIRVGWMPDEYWTFGDEIILSWYQIGKPELYTSRITNYIDEAGNLISDAFDPLRTTWPELQANLTGTTVDLALGNSETMPVETQVTVDFAPTVAVWNLSAGENQQNGKVGFSEERLHPQSDGVKEIDGHNRYKNATEVLAQAEAGYRVNIKQLALAVPMTFNGEGTITPVTFGENNTFTAEIPVTSSTALLENPTGTTVSVKGYVEVVLADTKGNAQHVRVVLEDARIPLDIGFTFEKMPKGNGGSGGGGGGPRPIVPETIPETVPETVPALIPETIPEGNDNDSAGESPEDLWMFGDGSTPVGNMTPGSKRRSPATGDRTTTAMLMYAIASLLSGVGAVGFWRHWQRGRKKEDE